MIVTAKHIIIGDGQTVLNDYAILIDEAGKIKNVGNRESLIAGAHGEKVLSFPDSTILPGLIDLHAHLGHYAPAKRQWQNSYMLAYITAHHAQKALKLGVTTLRDVASPHLVTQTLMEAGKMGYLPLPRIVPCDLGICITGGHGSSFGLGEGVEEIDGPWEARRVVRKRVKAGCRWIKAMTSHRAEPCEFTYEELVAITEESHRLGAKVAAHAGTHSAIQTCIDAHVDSIEHGTFMTMDQALAIKEKGIAWVPTIMVYTELYKSSQKTPVSDLQQENYRYYSKTMDFYHNIFPRLAHTGILIGAGTDYLLANGETCPLVSRELISLTECGLSPLKAIQAGTANGAKILNLEKITGQIKSDLMADLLVVDGNPAEHIEDLENVRQVFFSGKTVYQKF